MNQVQTTPRRAMSGNANAQRDYLEPSPARRAGILVTPGTAGGRKKNVSFQASSKHLATPRDYPGRFPSPFTVKKELAAEIQESDANLLKENSAVTHKTTNRTSRAQLPAATVAIPSFDDITLDMNAPRSTSGTFWKKEHDLGQQEHNAYASKSTSQLSRIAKKEQLAKRYARDKENEAAQLADALRHEQMRVAELEKQVAEYVAQLARAVKKYGDYEYDVDEHRERTANHAKLESRKMGSPRRGETEPRTNHSQRTNTHSAPHIQPDNSDIWAAPEPSKARPSRARPRTELAANNTTTTTTTVAASTRSPLQARTPNPLMSSPFPVSAKAPTSTPSYRRHAEPLAVPNLSAAIEKQGKLAVQEAQMTTTTTTTTTTTLSEERKLAAKRRLEEKKRARSAVA